MRPAQFETASSHIDAQDIVLVLGLSLISYSTALLIVNGGWSF
jgi:hypothetical protein